MKKKLSLLGLSGSPRNMKTEVLENYLSQNPKNIDEYIDLFPKFENSPSGTDSKGIALGDTFFKYKSQRQKKKNPNMPSNSEIALGAGLVGAKQQGIVTNHVSLKDYFRLNDPSKIYKPDELKQKILEADGILISTPVYLGDSSSIVTALINFMKKDKDLRDNIRGKIYGGISVAAKRNGGQETTLLYQLMNMLSLEMLGVGNDWKTTTQYGGTCHAGDVGAVLGDKRGLSTAFGTGERIGKVLQVMDFEKKYSLKDKPKVGFLILQDQDNVAQKFTENIANKSTNRIDSSILNATSSKIFSCIGCDTCPAVIGIDEETECIITSKKDNMDFFYEELQKMDSIVPVIYNPKNYTGNLKSTYQFVMERLRVLRRSNYVLSDRLVAPLVIEDLGASGTFQQRASTAMLRQHTILANPMTAYLQDGKLINKEDLEKRFEFFMDQSKRTTIGRIAAYADNINPDALKYNTTGYFHDQFENAGQRDTVTSTINTDRENKYKEAVTKRLRSKE